MQSLIHGNFEGTAQKRVYALVGASAAIAAAVGPLIGGFITTYTSWRLAFLGEAIIIAVVLSGIGRVRDVAYTGPRGVDVVGSALSVVGMGGVVLGILVWQEGGEAVAALMAAGAVALGSLVWWLRRRKREGEPALLDPDLFRSTLFRYGITGQMLQQIALGGTMIALPIYLQMVLEYNAMEAGLSIAPLSLSMFGLALLAGRRAGRRRPAAIIRAGFALVTLGLLVLLPIVPRATSGWWLVVPLIVVGSGLGLLVSQLNNYTLSPIVEERVSEAAGVNSAAGSFGLSFGLAFAGAIMLATAVHCVHPDGRGQRCAGPGRAAAGGGRTGRGRRGHEQHGAGSPARGPARGRPGRDHPHQHRRPAAGPPGGALHPDPRRPGRPGELVPHDAPARPRALRGRRHGPRRLTPAGPTGKARQ
jgi:MFS family permease